MYAKLLLIHIELEWDQGQGKWLTAHCVEIFTLEPGLGPGGMSYQVFFSTFSWSQEGTLYMSLNVSWSWSHSQCSVETLHKIVPGPGVVSFTDPPVLTWHRPIYFSCLAVVSGTLP